MKVAPRPWGRKEATGAVGNIVFFSRSGESLLFTSFLFSG